MKPRALNLPCFAKINRSLRILGKRDDGYHELRILFQTISLHDQLVLVSRDDEEIKLSSSDKSVPLDDTNLVVRAAWLLREITGIREGVEIALLKRIPMQSGLGGGSSDGACALLGLNCLWGSPLTFEELQKLGSRLGADVPFFFAGGSVKATGIGATLFPLAETSKERLIVISPPVGVSTKDAYEALKAATLTSSKSPSILTSSFAEPVLNDCDQWPLHNDFEAVIFEIEPEIKRAKQALLDAGARGALLTGSGSSVFGLFDDEMSRQRALNDLKIEAGWRVFPCSTISRSEYIGAMDSAGVPLC